MQADNFKVIYDLGANNGCDIGYYLLKADKVVAVEANPKHAAAMKSRFAEDIATNRLVVENVVLSVDGQSGKVPFYIHKTKDVLSQFPEPSPDRMSKFEKIELQSKSILDIIAEHGKPYYVKIDLEGYDAVVLRALFEKQIRPSFISAESHSIEIFALLVALGNYNSFTLLEGKTIPKRFANHTIQTKNGPAQHAFLKHSAGPFGEDLNVKWGTADNFLHVLAIRNLGWRDIHATNILEADHNYRPYETILKRHTVKSIWQGLCRSIGLLPNKNQ